MRRRACSQRELTTPPPLILFVNVALERVVTTDNTMPKKHSLPSPSETKDAKTVPGGGGGGPNTGVAHPTLRLPCLRLSLSPPMLLSNTPEHTILFPSAAKQPPCNRNSPGRTRYMSRRPKNSHRQGKHRQGKTRILLLKLPLTPPFEFSNSTTKAGRDGRNARVASLPQLQLFSPILTP